MSAPVSTIPDGGLADCRTLILGIGNLLWADEGFGIRAAEALNAAYEFPEDVRIMDGGTQGMFLLPYVRGATNLLIFDAIEFGLAPGELRVIRDGDVPQYMGARKMSMHQTGFQEVLAAAGMFNDYPERLALIGVQPELLDDYGGSLTPCIRARIPEAIGVAIELLEHWGIAAMVRRASPQRTELIGPDEMAIPSYETVRAV